MHECDGSFIDYPFHLCQNSFEGLAADSTVLRESPSQVGLDESNKFFEKPLRQGDLEVYIYFG